MRNKLKVIASFLGLAALAWLVLTLANSWFPAQSVLDTVWHMLAAATICSVAAVLFLPGLVRGHRRPGGPVSPAELEEAFDATASPIRIISTGYDVLRSNRAFNTLSTTPLHPDTTRKCFEHFPGPLCHTPQCPLAIIAAGEECVETEVESQDACGRQRVFVVMARPLHGPNGRLTGIVESLHDITELRRAQSQLYHSQLLANLGEMTAGIAHEVNNPLGSILLYSELLLAGETSPQTRRDLRVIHDEAKRAARVISDLLTYSRRGNRQVRRIDLNRVLEKVVQMRNYPESVRNIATTTDFQDSPLTVRGDSSQLNQLFMNLVLNAEEALAGQGGGHIVIRSWKDGEWAKVAVSDDGPGIPPDNLKQIFYPFFTTKQPGEGTGLGLSTCYGIATGHRGLIRAENNPAGGATFIVELPLAESSPRQKDGQPDIGAKAPGPGGRG